ncbi:MAG: SH3 domain-containing protein [Caldilineaceae bacterium]
MNKLRISILLLLLLLFTAACGGGEEPTPTPTRTPEPGGQVETLPTPTPQPAVPVTDTQSTTNAPTAQAAPPSTTDEGAADEQEVATVNAALLNIRSGPSTDNEIVATAEEGQQFTIEGRSDDGQWVQLGQNGSAVGWAAAEFVTVGTGTPAGTAGNGATTQAPTAAPSTGGGAALSASMASPDFGAQAFLWWRQEVADRDLQLLQDAGFNWVKQTFAWETIEGAGKGQFDWARPDFIVNHAREHNLRLLARLSSDPVLSNFWAGAPPQNIDNYADFAFEVASRYNCQPGSQGCIHAYQIWNEPNLAREWGNQRPNPAQYAEMLRKTYAAIKRGNPNAIVINAGMAPTGDNNELAMPDDIFYDQLYQAMGSSDGYFDMLGVHGAGFAAPPELDPAEAASNQKYGGYRFFAFRHVEDIRAIMVRYGDESKRVVLLEFGWTFDSVNPAYKWHGADAGITDMVQADYLKRAYIYADQNWQPWIGLMSLLTMPNIDWLEDGNPQDEEQYWWAILDPGYPDLFFRPAYVVLCIYFNDVKGQVCKYDPSR